MGRVAQKPRLRLHRPRIEHVMQLGKADCVIAACAMLADGDYTMAWLFANTRAPWWRRWGLSAKKAIEILGDLTERSYRYQSLPRPHPFLADYNRWPDLAALAVIHMDGDKKSHMIAWEPHGKRVHDPNWHCGIPLRTYRRWIEPTVRILGFILPQGEPEPDGAA